MSALDDRQREPLSALHRVWKLGHNIDTDLLMPGHAMKLGMQGMKAHCLARERPEFAAQVHPGDVIVAGAGFGIGSSREQAASVLVELGVAAVIAPDFGGLYFRNAFNVGLLLLTADLQSSVADGDLIRIDTENPAQPLVRDAQGREHLCEPIPMFLLERVRLGGLLPELKQRLGQSSHV